MITQSGLKELLEYRDGVQGWGLYWVWHPNKTIRTKLIGKRFGSFDSYGYKVGGIFGKLYKEHRLIWLYVHGEFPPEQIDHIDGIESNNELSNLRLATRQQNLQNRKPDKNTSSKYLGVSWNKKANKWVAFITVSNKTIYLGLFVDEIKAAEARDKSSTKYFGEFANLNFK